MQLATTSCKLSSLQRLVNQIFNTDVQISKRMIQCLELVFVTESNYGNLSLPMVLKVYHILFLKFFNVLQVAGLVASSE